MKNLRGLTDYRQSAYTAQLRQLEKTQQAILANEQQQIDTFKANFATDIKKTEGNVKALRIAVAKSKQPGAINYRQSLPEEREIQSLRSFLSELDNADTLAARARQEAETTLGKERSRWKQSDTTSIRTLTDWLDLYGKPKRQRGPFERSLSLVCRPVTIIPGVRSRDGGVEFRTERSNAKSLRRGNLIN